MRTAATGWMIGIGAGLRQAGCELNFYNPVLVRKLQRNIFRDHRKLVVVDGETAFVGGFIVLDEYDPPGERQPGWHDAVVRVEGPCVGDWVEVFHSSRERVGRGPLPVERTGAGQPTGADVGRGSVRSQ